MKMFYGKTPIKSLNIKHYEMSTQDATMVPSDLQAGVTAYAKGKKVTGTGKAFEHANYGKFQTNFPIIVSGGINVIEVASTEYSVKHTIALSDMKNIDFNISQLVANITIDSTEYPITSVITDGILMLQCEQSVYVQLFYGKDNYV